MWPPQFLWMTLVALPARPFRRLQSAKPFLGCRTGLIAFRKQCALPAIHPLNQAPLQVLPRITSRESHGQAFSHSQRRKATFARGAKAPSAVRHSQSRIDFLREMCASPRPVALSAARNSPQIINQSFRVSKISRAEPLCEPVVNWFDDRNRFSATALLAQQAGEARRGSQLP
jgi:hypothetical protein